MPENVPPNKVDFDFVRKLHFYDIERDIREGRVVSAQRIVERVKSRGDVPIPTVVIDLLCDYALRKVPTKMGKPARDPTELKLRDLQIRDIYFAIFDRLSAEDPRPLPDDFLAAYGEILEEISMTPSDKAAEIVSRIFGRENISAARIKNIAYPRKLPT